MWESGVHTDGPSLACFTPALLQKQQQQKHTQERGSHVGTGSGIDHPDLPFTQEAKLYWELKMYRRKGNLGPQPYRADAKCPGNSL